MISAKLDTDDALLNVFTDLSISSDLRRRIALLLLESAKSEIARNFVISNTDFLQERYNSEIKPDTEEDDKK